MTTLAFQFHIIYMLTDSSASEYLSARFTRLLISFVLLYFPRPQGGNMEVVNKLYAMYSLSRLQSLLWSYCDVYMIIIRHIGSKQSYLNEQQMPQKRVNINNRRLLPLEMALDFNQYTFAFLSSCISSGFFASCFRRNSFDVLFCHFLHQQWWWWCMIMKRRGQHNQIFVDLVSYSVRILFICLLMQLYYYRPFCHRITIRHIHTSKVLQTLSLTLT